MGSEFTYQPKWDPIGSDPQPHLFLGALGVVLKENQKELTHLGSTIGDKHLHVSATPSKVDGGHKSLCKCCPLKGPH